MSSSPSFRPVAAQSYSLQEQDDAVWNNEEIRDSFCWSCGRPHGGTHYCRHHKFIRPSIAFGGWGSDKEYNERGDQPREAIGHSPSQQSPTPKATLPLQAAAKKHRQQKGLLPNKESSSSPVNKPTSLATPLRAPRHVNPYADPSDPFSTKSLAAAWGVDP